MFRTLCAGLAALALASCGGGGSGELVPGATATPAPLPAATATPAPLRGPAATAAPLRTVTTDLLVQGDFEDGMGDWTDWGNSHVVDGAGASGSLRALRVGTGAGGAGYTTSGVIAGAAYRLTAQAKVSDPSEVAYLGVHFLDASGAKIAEQAVPASSTAYALTTVDITAPASAYLVVVYAWKNAGSGHAFVDDVTLARLPAPGTDPANLLSNPGFDAGMTHWVDWGNAGIDAAPALRVGTAAGGAAQEVGGIVGGATYRLTGQVKVSAPSEDAYLGVYLVDAAGTKVAEQMTPVNGTAFALATVEIAAPANAARAVVYVWKNAGTGYVYVDDVALTVASAAPLPPPPPRWANMLANPGFESGMTGWVNWGNALVLQAGGMSGSNGLRVGTAAGGAAQDVSGIVPGGEYQVSARVRLTLPAEVAYLGINMLDASGNVVAQRAVEFGDTMFQTASVQLTAPAAAVKAVVFVWKNASSGHALADDFFFARMDENATPPAATNLVVNPGFENQLAGWGGGGATVVTDAASGTYAASLGSGGGVSQDLALVPGQTYRLSAQTKMIGVVGAGIFDANGVSVVIRDASFLNIIGYHTLPLPATAGSYSSAAIEFTVPANASTSTLSVYVEGGTAGGGLLHVDNISVAPL